MEYVPSFTYGKGIFFGKRNETKKIISISFEKLLTPIGHK
jgi:hypothetical protein